VVKSAFDIVNNQEYGLAKVAVSIDQLGGLMHKNEGRIPFLLQFQR